MDSADSPGIVVPPPVYVAVMIGLALAMDYFWHIQISYLPVMIWVGYAMVAIAIIILGLCAWQFHRHETDIRPHKPDSCMINRGPYRLSRNPIYLSFLLLQLGYGCIEQNAWVLIGLPISYLILRYLVIAREEVYLRRRFADEYEQFCRTVNRWL